MRGYSKTPGKIIMGGPMMGIAQYTDDVVITKGSSGLLIFDEEEAKFRNRSNVYAAVSALKFVLLIYNRY